MKTIDCLIFALVSMTGLVQPNAAAAQIAISANDGKVSLVDGVNMPRPVPAADTVTVIDLGVSPPKVLAVVRAPASVVGPPHSVAIAPDRSIALVTASTRIDPANPKATVPDNTLTVIDLRSSPPAVLAALETGRGAAGVAINGAGTLALVANRSEGTISVFTIAGKTVAPAGKVDLGAPDSMPSEVMFSADGKTAYVSRNAASDNRISLLSIAGTQVEYARRDLFAGLQPYGMDLTPSGAMAVVANIGVGLTGGTDVVSLVDLTADPPRAIDQIPVGAVPEGIAVSPNGRYVAVTVMNGSNLAKTSPFFHDFGLLKIIEIKGRVLAAVAEIKAGHWCQGAAWTPNSSTILVQCMVEQEIQLYAFDGKALKPAGAIKVGGGPAGIRSTR